MWRFLLGIALGVIGKILYDQLRTQALPESAADLQRRAVTLLEEARQLLQEVRQEIVAASGRARELAEDRLSRIRATAGAGGGEPPADQATRAEPAGPAGSAPASS
jgi:hypothetical protein